MTENKSIELNEPDPDTMASEFKEAWNFHDESSSSSDEEDHVLVVKERLREFLRREGQNKTRAPMDATRGLVYSQGSLLQHLVFAIVAWVILTFIETETENT
jgi:hypothetical protein